MLAPIGVAAVILLFLVVAYAFNGPNAGIYTGVVVAGVMLLIGYKVWQSVAATAKTKREIAQRDAQHRHAWEQAEQTRQAEFARQQYEFAAEEQRKRLRWENLVARFGQETAGKITSQHLWVGATREMVIEAFGQPQEVSEKVFKSKTKRVLKYYAQGGDRFGLKITFDDDQVVGWER
ncbi:MAG: hypothetical protein JWP97_4630 [Labilithrix sp.]|nr:hypothetical protein [Labilithrix sp.]